MANSLYIIYLFIGRYFLAYLAIVRFCIIPIIFLRSKLIKS
jgi:hypothetical protein